MPWKIDLVLMLRSIIGDLDKAKFTDERIKQNITDAGSQWDDIKALKIRNYKRKDQVSAGLDITMIGVIAQELEKVAPYAVNKVVSEEHELDDMRVINESNLTYLLINSVKELTKRVEELENEIKIIKTT